MATRGAGTITAALRRELPVPAAAAKRSGCWMATRGAGTITAALRRELPEPAAAAAALPACSSAHSRWFATARASISAEVSLFCRHASPFLEIEGEGMGAGGCNANRLPLPAVALLPPLRAACACDGVRCTCGPFIRRHDGCEAQPAGITRAPTAPHIPATGEDPRAVADLLRRPPRVSQHAL